MNDLDLESFTPLKGSHDSRDEGMCVMEAVAYVAGEPHSDSPRCACPVISSFLRSWNDSITDDDRRRDLLNPFILRIVGTKASEEVEMRRSWMAFDWLVRTHLVAFLRLSEGLCDHADKLESLPELTAETLSDAKPIIAAARAAAGDAARAAARAARAARDAARDAARAAARAAGAAAGAAALSPTVAELQKSASELVDRMIGLATPNHQ